ncbi:MAG: YtxH domain-containing protein [Bacteroidales bacterium]|jgi:gas vesicle protein|nr:YtxH domain-containing protein [Bacteroidales bacterium]
MAKSGIKLLTAAAFGMAVGVGIGMLIAPAKGSKTRKRLKKQFLHLADLVQNEISDDVDFIKSTLSPDMEEVVEDQTDVKPEGEAK